MARDYAKKHRPAGKGAAAPKRPAARPPRKVERPKRSAPSHSQHGALSLKWILSLAAVGGFIGFIVYLNTLPDGQRPTPVAPAPQTTQPQKPASTAKQDSARSREREQSFRFYDMLPESEVVPPKVQEYSPNPNIQDFNYVVQSGSFRSQEDAERQRAQIAFQGLRANVQRIDLESGSVWYRVNVGPFESRSQMNAAVDKLVSINIQPLVRKIPKEG